MKGTYETDREWADRYLPQVKEIISGLLVRTASFELDTKEASDLIVYHVKGAKPIERIAVRLRRPGVFFDRRQYWSQFTIRSHRSSGVETELAKVVRGLGDWFFYGHVEEGKVRHWMVIDLAVFRATYDSPAVSWEQMDNKDGTLFYGYHVLSFPERILVACSDTIKLAMQEGIGAVEPLETEPWLASNLPPYEPPPCLQKFLADNGGNYRAIPEAAWQKWNADMAAWHDRRLAYLRGQQ